MKFIGDARATITKNWYIRHGVNDWDTSFQITINRYTKNISKGYEVNFALPWNRGHSVDYDLNDIFAWIDNVVKSAKK